MALSLGKVNPVPTGDEAEWVPDAFWMLWRREKSFGGRSMHNAFKI
jgi:hypothetical protein